ARPARRTYAGSSCQLALDARLSMRLRDLSQSHGATLYITLLTGWAILLMRLSRREDIVVGTPVANRTQGEIENLIGFFVNTLALRLDLSGSPNVEELFAQVKTHVLAAQRHQDIPF